MDDVVKSTVVASLIGAALGGTSYLFLAPHKTTILSIVLTFMPQAVPDEAILFLPQAVILTIALVMGLLGFAVAFLIVGTSLSSRSRV